MANFFYGNIRINIWMTWVDKYSELSGNRKAADRGLHGDNNHVHITQTFFPTAPR